MNNIKPIFGSSINPTELSLTIESGSKTIIGLIGVFLAYRGINAVGVTDQLNAIVAVVVATIPAGFTVWHAMQTLYGLVRKLFVQK